MPRPGLRVLVVAAALACGPALPGPAAADVITLKNGATIVAESWEVRGGDLVVRQRGGTIVVPRADVVKIEPTAGAPAPAAPRPPDAAAPATGGAPAAVTREEILQAIDDLRRRRPGDSLARAETARRIATLLSQLGTRAFKEHDYDEAMSRFREALGYDPGSGSAQFGLAATALALGQDLQARTTLERALLDHPEDADLHALLGDVYYGQERGEDALASWRRAYALRADPILKERIDKLVREQSVDGAYRRSEALHFTLKYDGERGGADLGAEILAYLEDRYGEFAGRFAHYPQQPIVVIVYPQRQFYEATQAESNVGGLFDGKIRVPIGGLRQIDPEARRVLAHELAHAFIAGKSRGGAPRWLQEGLAQLLEGKTTATAEAASMARQYREQEDKGGWGTTFTYATSLSFTEFLVETEGFHRIVEALDTMSRGVPPDTAIEQVTRFTLPELRQAWGEWLVRRNLQ